MAFLGTSEAAWPSVPCGKKPIGQHDDGFAQSSPILPWTVDPSYRPVGDLAAGSESSAAAGTDKIRRVARKTKDPENL
jgi:hypothetical protein